MHKTCNGTQFIRREGERDKWELEDGFATICTARVIQEFVRRQKLFAETAKIPPLKQKGTRAESGLFSA
jgi:hypothetical protein